MRAPNRLLHWLGAGVAAAGYAVIGMQVVLLWLDPSAWGDVRWIGYMAQLMMPELTMLAITLVAGSLC
jgi:hypothetical protein